MITMSHAHQKELIQVIFDYLKGKSLDQIQAQLKLSCDETSARAKQQYQSIQISPELKQAIFKALKVPNNHHQNYQHHQNVLDLISHLHQDGFGHDHLSYLLYLIETTHPKRSWLQFIQNTVFYTAASGLSLFALLKTIGLKRILAIFANVPLVGMIISLTSYFRSIYEIFYYGLSNLNSKLISFSFKTSALILTLTAYTLLFMAPAVLSPLMGILFVSSSALDFVLSLTQYLMIKLSPIHRPESQNWEDLAHHARKINQQHRTQTTTWIKLAAALLITATIATWCFFPPSLILVITCISLIHAIGLIKTAILRQVDYEYTHQLQQELVKLNTNITPKSYKLIKQPEPMIPQKGLRFFSTKHPKQDQVPVMNNPDELTPCRLS